MMVIGQVIAAHRRHSLELVVRQTAAEVPPGGRKSVIELIIRIIHLIHLEYLLQAAFIERAVMRPKRKALYHRRYLLPHVRKHWSIIRIFLGEPVHPLTEPLLVFRLRVNQAIESIHNPTPTNDYHSNAAHAGAAFVGGLEINCRKVFHNQ